VREAFRTALEERPGPVLLELPEDIAADEVGDVALIPPHAVDRPIASPEALDRAAEFVRNAKRPLLMITSAASRPQSSEALS
ncbi:acetolactate synthase large subunit, partial [Vibrio cholerae]|nr:acetolactate synthase large subunit [Vibrio cholerae]